MSMPRYTCRLSALIISPSISYASCAAKVVLPHAVGPNMVSRSFKANNLDRQFIKHPYKTLIHCLIRADGIRKWHIDHLVIAYAYHHVALSVKNGVNHTCSQSARQDSVAS